jgi:hypothetical protein
VTGPAAAVPCHRCGTVPPGRPGPRPTCPPCRVAGKLSVLLDDGTGTQAAALAPLAAALAAAPGPALLWLRMPHVGELLPALARGDVPLTHEGLHAWPQQTAARYLRHRLMACGVLPPGDRHLLDFEAWLHHRLAAAADAPHEQLLRQFALWHQLPRLRADAAARPLRSTACQYATGQFTAAQNFLRWLHQHSIAPAGLGQAHLDTWAAGHRVPSASTPAGSSPGPPPPGASPGT